METLIIIAVYVVLWWLTARDLNRNEPDDKMKLLWVMVSLFWPVIWSMALGAFIIALFETDERDLR